MFILRLIELQFDFFAQPFRLDLFGSIDFDFSDDRTRLHGNDYLHAVAFRLGEDANVQNGASFVKGLNILLDYLIRIRLAHLGSHLRENPFLADRPGSGVLHVD